MSLQGAPRLNRVTLPLGILGIMAATAACSANQTPPATSPSAGTPPVPSEQIGATMMQPANQPASTAAPTPASEPGATGPMAVSDAQLAGLDDAHLLGVIQAAADRAVRITRVEETRGTDREVKRFARGLAASHVDTESRFESQLSSLGVEPASSPVSDQVRTEADSRLSPLRNAQGRQVDQIYVDQQLRELTRALDLVGRAAAHVTKPELRTAIEGMRSRLEMDAREAREIGDALRSGKTDWHPDAYDPDKVQR